jgi:hypothetical protein
MEVKPDPYLHQAFYSVLEEALSKFVVEVHEQRFTPHMTATFKSLYGMIPALRVDASDDTLGQVNNLMATLTVMDPMVMRGHPTLQLNAVQRCADIATTIRGRRLPVREAS